MNHQSNSLKLLDAECIWEQAAHNAFTDLEYYKKQWICVFREGSAHVSPDGALRVITSSDGKKWQSSSLLQDAEADLRDAKICTTPQGQLMLTGGAALHDKSQHTHQTLLWLTDDPSSWGPAKPIGDPNFWIWRVTWQNNTAWGAAYDCRLGKAERLYKSTDGLNFDMVKKLRSRQFPNEASICFVGDTMYCLVRRDWKTATGLIGQSRPPYTRWKWKNLGIRIGGPNLIALPDGRLLTAVRLYDNKVRTALCYLDFRKGKLTECLALPSGGDTSYAGMVLQGSTIWISYHSSHGQDKKTAIYLATVKL